MTLPLDLPTPAAVASGNGPAAAGPATDGGVNADPVTAKDAHDGRLLSGRGVPVPPSLVITVHGQPAPQGSKRAFVRGGRAVIVEQTEKRLRPWREDVKQAALDARRLIGGGTLHGPLTVRMVFTLRKPASAPRRRRTWPDRTPDLSKLCRATEDALTDAGVWEDDARVVEYTRLAKVFPGEDQDALDVPGARIEVRQVQP